MSLKEDTVSADRKERIIFDPDAWRKSDRSGRKTVAITSRQNFDNEKFTRKADQEKVDEGTIQPSGDSKVDSAGPSQSDTISNDKPKKSNNPQIEFVTGAEKASSSSTATGNAQMNSIKKISEVLVREAIKQVKGDDWDDKNPPFDPDTKVEKEFKKPHNPNRSPMDTVRALAQKGMQKQKLKQSTTSPGETVLTREEVEQIDELSKTTLGSYVKKATVSNRNAALSHANNFRDGDEAAASKAAKTIDKREKGISSAVNRLSEEEVELSETCKDEKKKKPVKKEGTIMSEKKTYAEFMAEMNFDSNGVYRHKGTYGNAGKGAKYGETDYDSEHLDKSDDEEGAAKAPAAKKGRGRPSGSYGTYKARSAETKAAAAAKSAATKAANKSK